MNDQQFFSLGCELITSVKNIFPKNAEFEFRYDFSKYAFVCTVCWKLNNDENRPNKSSRIIVIVIPRGLMEDSNNENRKIIHECFNAFIQSKYNQFEPDHNVSRNESPPTEEWRLDINYLGH